MAVPEQAIAVFDCFSGIAGDMTLAALISAGAHLTEIQAGLERLELPPFSLAIETVQRGGIEAALLHVEIAEEHTYQPDEMRTKVSAAGFPARAEQRALAAIGALEQGEAEAHGTDKPHLHEAGGVDALIDIAGSMLALEALNVAECYCPVVTVGSGAIARTAHGMIPASPGPAAAAILQRHGFPLRFVQSAHEMVTPTGAAILAAVAKPSAVTMLTAATGIGAGTFDPDSRPNALRIFIGQRERPGAPGIVSELAANIDDMTAVMLSEARDRLMQAGALDAWTEAIGMKKGRPATKLCALVPSGQEERFAAIFLRETTTLGVRITSHRRFEMGREIQQFESSLGTVAIKVSSYDGHSRVTPEFEDVRRISIEQALPIIEVQRLIEYELRDWSGAQ
jgi:uncharacterized protein (TIGR00299 family) protein